MYGKSVPMSVLSGAGLTVLGGGPFGLLLTRVITSNFAAQPEHSDRPVGLWVSDPREAQQLQAGRVGRVMGQPFPLSRNVRVITDYSAFERGPQVLFVAVPSRQFEDTMDHLIQHLAPDEEHLIVIFTKGLLGRASRRRTGGPASGNWARDDRSS